MDVIPEMFPELLARLISGNPLYLFQNVKRGITKHIYVNLLKILFYVTRY
jgi:hypothetical protein